MADADKLTTKDVAEALGTEPKQLRVFLRSEASPIKAVGAGSRYEFTKRDIPKLKKAFTAWAAADTKRRDDRAARIAAERAAKADAPATQADEELDGDVPAPEDFDLDDDVPEAATA